MIYHTTQGELEQVTFSKFLEMVPRKTLKNGITEWRHNVQTCVTRDEQIFNFERRTAVLSETSEKTLAGICKANLYAQASHLETLQKAFEDHVEDWALEYLIEFGTPTLLVKLKQDTYFVANPDDFAIVQNDRGLALVCYHPYRLDINTIVDYKPVKPIKALDTAQKTLDGLSGILEAPALKIEDQGESAFLTEESKLVMKNTISQTHHEHGGVIHDPIYLSCTVAEDNVQAGLEAISKDINLLAAAGMIKSCLAPLSTLSLALTRPGRLPSVVVFAILHVPFDAVKLAKNSCTHYVEEGCTGKEIGDLSLKLPEGQFFWELRVPLSAKLPFIPTVDSELIDLEIKKALKYLPERTEVVSVTPLSISDLSYPYRVIFYNPLFMNIESVEFQYVRQIVRVEEGKLEEFNLLTEIKYNKKKTT